MEITLDKKTNTEGLIKIKVTEGDYQPRVEEKVRDYARKANIKGFRQGKVPAGVIRKMFGKSILVEEMNSLLSSRLSDYIKENNLKIIGDPLPNQEKAQGIDWESQRDFEFEYQIGMVEDFKYELSPSVKVTGYEIAVDDKVIEETVNDLKKRFGNVTHPETTAAGDNLFGDLRPANNDSGISKEHAFIATEKLSDASQKEFIGKNKGEQIEFDIRQAFPGDDAIAELLAIENRADAAGVSGRYVFTINTISRTELAAMDQQLFDRVFGKDAVNSEETFLDKVRSTIGDNYKRETEHFLDHHIEDHFIQHTDINIPHAFMKSWLKASSNGEVTDAVLEKEYNDYVRGLKWDLIKNKVADDHSIKIESPDVREKAKELIISQFGGPAIAEQLKDQLDAFADNYLSHENGKNFMRLYNQLKNERILSLIKDKITVQKKKVTAEEFRKIVEEHKH